MKKEIRKAATLFLAFLITGIILEISFGWKYHSPRSTIDHATRVMEKKISQLHHYMDLLAKEDSFRDRLSISGMDLFNREGLAFIISEDDSIVFWSTSHIPDTGSIQFSSDSTGIIRLPNGYYYYDSHDSGGLGIHGLYRVKNDFAYTNEYLSRSFQKDLGLPPGAQISLEKGEHNVLSPYGVFLFSVDFSGEHSLPDGRLFLLLVFYGFALIALTFLIYISYEAILPKRSRSLLLPILLIIDLAILRWLIFFFEIPPALYDSPIFGPYYFASSGLNRSLGDAFLNNLILFAASYLFFFRYKAPEPPNNRRFRYITAVLLLLVIYLSFTQLIAFYEIFIRNSSFSLSLDKLFSFSVAGLLGLLTLSFSTIAFFFFSARLSGIIIHYTGSPKAYTMLVVVSLILLVPVSLIFNLLDPITYIFLAVLLLSYLFVLKTRKVSISLTSILMILLLFSFLANYELNKVNLQKEMDYRKLIAEELSLERDPMLEFEFRKARGALHKDTVLTGMFLTENASDERIANYILQTFSGKSWKEYEVLVTVCSGTDLLEVQPEGYIVNCYSYFSGLISTIGDETVSEDLFFLRDDSENNNYIGVLDFEGVSGESYKVFIEFFSFMLPEEGQGYPELLIDRSMNIKSDLSNYSYARYRNGKLTYKYGPYSYRIDLSSYGDSLSTEGFYAWNGYSHYVYLSKDSNILIISRQESSWLDSIAPFSYLFILFGLIALVIALVTFVLRGKRLSDLLFRDRFQIAVLSIVVISFVVIGTVSERYVIFLHEKKNNDLLNEKTLSVLTEIESKLGDINEWTPESEQYLAELLIKFSRVFFSDINLFDVSGDLISSSRPQIFDAGLISHRMDPVAYLQLHQNQKLQLIQTERIGKQEYLSSYIPFRNNEDQIMGYLNLPYFARQKELRNELMNFLVAYVNIYVLMIVLAIIITIFISRYLTKPLRLIREKIAQTKLGSLNEKIEWKSSDEIGSLVSEYNRMLDELAASAELLARSERESAWREMAQQIAHEIKNPLTPMKLSVQHLKKAWDDKQPDWEQRFEKFTRMIVEQIEALSAIASEFSDFAKMPKARIERIDLRKSIQHAVNLYDDGGNIQFEVDLPEDRPMWVNGDKEQLIRVFNNLIKNSIQAIGKKPGGLIRIRGVEEEEMWKVIISDNGSGIPHEMSEKIFSPNFTTKSGGMGLGLAVVQSIIRESGGVIRFESEADVGTSFYIYLPEAGVQDM